MCLQCPTSQTDLNGNLVCEFCLVPIFSLGGDARAHYLRCATAKDEGKTFGRKHHLVEHLQKEHGISSMSLDAATWKYAVIATSLDNAGTVERDSRLGIKG